MMGASSNPSADGRPRVLYVMGAGRSGSTTLGITLGNCAGVFYAGELDSWLPRSGVPQLQSEERVRFWERVREELEDPAAAAELFGTDAYALERSASLLRPRRWPLRRRLRGRYRAVAADLYRAVARASGARYIADTSHYPLRALELQRLEEIELYLLFLVRDPQGVVASFNRRDVGEYRKSTLHSNVYLWITHLLSLLVFARQPRERRLFVRYEDFVASPGDVVRRILDLAGLADVGLPDFEALDVGVPLQGNRISRTQSMSLKARPDAARATSRVTALLQSPIVALLALLRPSTAIPVAPDEAIAADLRPT